MLPIACTILIYLHIAAHLNAPYCMHHPHIPPYCCTFQCSLLHAPSSRAHVGIDYRLAQATSTTIWPGAGNGWPLLMQRGCWRSESGKHSCRYDAYTSHPEITYLGSVKCTYLFKGIVLLSTYLVKGRDDTRALHVMGKYNNRRAAFDCDANKVGTCICYALLLLFLGCTPWRTAYCSRRAGKAPLMR
jgi:hypothetical protein